MDEWAKTGEIARQYEVPVRNVIHWLATGEIRGTKRGRQWLVDPESAEAFLGPSAESSTLLWEVTPWNPADPGDAEAFVNRYDLDSPETWRPLSRTESQLAASVSTSAWVGIAQVGPRTYLLKARDGQYLAVQAVADLWALDKVKAAADLWALDGVQVAADPWALDEGLGIGPAMRRAGGIGPAMRRAGGAGPAMARRAGGVGCRRGPALPVGRGPAVAAGRLLYAQAEMTAEELLLEGLANPEEPSWRNLYLAAAWCHASEATRRTFCELVAGERQPDQCVRFPSRV